MGYDFTIQYRSNLLNVVANALSRILEASKGTAFLLSMAHFMLLAELKCELANNPE